MSRDVPTLYGLSRRRALVALRDAFAGVGIDSPDVDSRRLLTATLEIEPIALVTAGDECLTDDEAARLTAVAARRLDRVPVSRILGTRWFYGRPFALGAATLDPRPESETLVAAALDLLDETHATAPQVLDIGTGSGCLLLTILAERTDATGIGTDIVPDALAVASQNAVALGVAERASFRLGPDFAPIATIERGSFSMLVSNPPYIPTGDVAGLEPEVRVHDPIAALDGGGDGLATFRRLIEGIPIVQPTGWTVFEVGEGQAAAVAALCAAAFDPQPMETRFFDDLGGVCRCVAVRARL